MSRKGLTLLEVLMAILIMGIGMMSVFSLFPVAALMMGQAIERYQINEIVHNSGSISDYDALDFVKNNPSFVISQTGINFFAKNNTTNYPEFLYVDQAAAISGKSAFFALNVTDKIALAYYKPLLYGNISSLVPNRITNIFPDTSMMVVGQIIKGTFIPTNTFIASIDSNNSITLSNNTISPAPGILNNPLTLETTVLDSVNTSPAVINNRFFFNASDVELDQSGIALGADVPNYLVRKPSRLGRYSISYLFEKRTHWGANNPSRKYMFVFKGRSELTPDFPFEINPTSISSGLNSISVPVSITNLDYKKGSWIMLYDSLNTKMRSFHVITNVTTLGGNLELEIQPKMGFDPNCVFLLTDVVRVVDLGTTS